jgi:hypothetical protein
MEGEVAPVWLALQNALVGPFVAMMTFIGSMGNIPLATVLSANGVMFAGIMAFIYSDLVVPPLVLVNREYYGWKVALFIAGIMYVSMVSTALLLWWGFEAIGAIPETQRVVEEVTRFKIDYTFWFNLAFAVVAGVLVWMHRRMRQREETEESSDDSGPGFKRIVAYLFLAVDVGGLTIFAWSTLG